jgi:hypothetical protein
VQIYTDVEHLQLDHTVDLGDVLRSVTARIWALHSYHEYMFVWREERYKELSRVGIVAMKYELTPPRAIYLSEKRNLYVIRTWEADWDLDSDDAIPPPYIDTVTFFVGSRAELKEYANDWLMARVTEAEYESRRGTL